MPTHRSHLLNFALTLFLAATCTWGCGGSNWLELKLSGTDADGNTVDETISFRGTGATGLDDDEFHPSLQADGSTRLVAFFGTPQTDTYYGSQPVATLMIDGRLSSGEGEDPITHDRWMKFGLGPSAGSLALNFKDVKWVPIGPIDVERWHFTGDANHPLEFRGRSFSDSDLESRNLKGEIEFEFRADCSSDLRNSGGLCGGLHNRDWEDGKEIVQEVEAISGRPTCPAEVLKTFAGKGVGSDFRWMRGKYMQVDGGERLKCVVNSGGKAFLCGGEKTGVEADGCTWDVGAVAASENVSGSGVRYMYMWMTVSARAREGCKREITHCNNDVRAYIR